LAGGLSTAIGEALLQLVQFVWPEASPQFDHLARRVTDALRPEPPFTLQTPDGEVVTGIVILDRGRALLFFGTRQSALSRPAYRPPEQPYPDRGYDVDQPLWPRPYQR
jgi:hypothetical protein